MNIELEQVITMPEAARMWDIPKPRIHHSCHDLKGTPKRFKDGEDFRVTGRALLIRYSSRVREFGEPKYTLHEVLNR